MCDLSKREKAELGRHKLRLEELLGARLLYPEDRIEVQDSYRVIRCVKEIRQLPEFQTENNYDGRLFNLMLKIFRFRISDKSVGSYYYKEDKALF